MCPSRPLTSTRTSDKATRVHGSGNNIILRPLVYVILARNQMILVKKKTTTNDRFEAEWLRLRRPLLGGVTICHLKLGILWQLHNKPIEGSLLRGHRQSIWRPPFSDKGDKRHLCIETCWPNRSRLKENPKENFKWDQHADKRICILSVLSSYLQLVLPWMYEVCALYLGREFIKVAMYLKPKKNFTLTDNWHAWLPLVAKIM